MLELGVALAEVPLSFLTISIRLPAQYFGIARYLRLIDSHFVVWSTPRSMKSSSEQLDFSKGDQDVQFNVIDQTNRVITTGVCLGSNFHVAILATAVL